MGVSLFVVLVSIITIFAFDSIEVNIYNIVDELVQRKRGAYNILPNIKYFIT